MPDGEITPATFPVLMAAPTSHRSCRQDQMAPATPMWRHIHGDATRVRCGCAVASLNPALGEDPRRPVEIGRTEYPADRHDAAPKAQRLEIRRELSCSAVA
jgi:hypothetical protein